MKRILHIVLPALLFTSSAFSYDNGAWLEVAVDEMNELYTTGTCGGCQDGVFNAVSSSMIGWGIGLAIGIALITGLVNNSRGHSSRSTN